MLLNTRARYCIGRKSLKHGKNDNEMHYELDK